MNIPQWLWLILALICLGVRISEHNKLMFKKGDGVSAVISMIIELSLLIWGGFFDCWLK